MTDVNDIIMAVRTGKNMAEGAAELSLYIYPKLDTSIAAYRLGDVLGWIPRMQKARMKEIAGHIRTDTGMFLGNMTDLQRKILSEYLEAIGVYQRIQRGQSFAS